MIFLASDHAGFEVKEKLKNFFREKNIDFIDLGAYQYSKNDDYPDYAFKLARRIAKDKASKGILVCGTGAGMVIAANKVKGVRAVEAYDIYTAKLSREHNNSNILALSGWHLPFNKIKNIVSAWLKTGFSGEERHKRRLKKIEKYE